MRLLDVQAVLDREDGIRWVESQTTIFEEVLDDSPPQYAILSHCWENEVDYYEMTGLMRMDEHYRNEIKQRAGYKKIIQSCKQAQLDKYRWIWIDTCCIDKHNNSELTEAINSMYRWYSKSQKCYAYLYDVEDSIFPHQQDFSRFDKANGWPVWFSRGWTLQELIAPKQLEFFNRDWDLIGNKESLAETLEKITRIPIAVLRDKQTPRDFCVAQIMSWAADRKTTKAEDRAYSLLGLFAVNMHMTYGEGKKNAFLRLQRQIMGRYSDHSIFAWNPKGQFGQLDGSLASDPSYFRDCHGIERVNTEEFVNEVLGHRPVPDLAPLANLDDSSCLGVQIRLPVIAHQSDSESVLIRVIFACRDYYGNLITVDFKSFQSSFYRIPVAITRHVPHSPPELRTLYLARSAPYSDEDYHYFKLDDKCASYHGFTRRGSFPREFTGDTITFSSHTNDLVVLVYAARDGAKLRFAVVTGYYHGKASVHVVRDESSADHDSSWTDFSKKAYEMLWAAPIEDCVDSGVKCAHLARSIWDARVLWYTGTVETNVIVDVEQCPGCCIGPRERMTASNDPDGFVMPGLMKTVHNIRGLKLDGKCVRLCDCSGQRIRLGDYGHYSNGSFKPDGNIFEHAHVLGIDIEDSAYRPVTSRVSGVPEVLHSKQDWHGLAAEFPLRDEYLTLHSPKGLSLPNNQQLVLLLKALSISLADKYLVITIIQCSDLPAVDIEENRRASEGDSAFMTGGHLTEPGLFVPLCTIVSPQVWRRQPSCARRREQFKSIRQHFHALAKLYRLPGAEAGFESASRRMNGDAIRFLSNIFGLQSLKYYVGEITFNELFSMMETQSRWGSTLGCNTNIATSGGSPSNSTAASLWTLVKSWVARTPRGGTTAPPLLEKGKAFRPLVDKSRYLAARQQTRCEVQSISQSLSFGLLEHIHTAILNASENENHGIRVIPPRRRMDIHSMLEDVKALQTQLNAAVDDDEQRALEEDATGKVLWIFWCIILSGVEGRLLEIVDYILKEGNSMDLQGRDRLCQGLHEITEVIKETPHAYVDDDLAHLRRILLDAGAGISKHQLWLSAQADTAGNGPGEHLLNQPNNLPPM